MKIIHKQVKDMTPVEYKACLRANYGIYDGYMYQILEDCRLDGEPGQVIMLWDGPSDKTASLRGWALLTPVTTRGLLRASRYIKSKSKFTAQFWVKVRYRRKGYGKMLMNEVKKIDARPHVFPHNPSSAELFSLYDVSVSKYDRHWMRRKPRIA